MNAAPAHARRSGGALVSGLRCAALLAIAAAAPASASQPPAAEQDDGFRYTLQAGFGFSDNRLRERDDPQDDLFLDLLLGFSTQGETPRLAWRGSGQLQASHSLQGGRSERPRAELALALDWTLAEQRLYWHAAQLAAIEQVDPLLADTPDNRQQTRVFVTGPSLVFGAPSTWLGRLDARLALARAEESPQFDHRRESLTASLQRRSTPVLDWNLLGEHSEVSFRDNGPLNDFSRDDLLLRASRRLPRGELELALGRTWLDRRSGGRVQRPLRQASLTLGASAGHQLRLDYADALTDAGRELSLLHDPAERLWQEGRRARIDGSLYRLRSFDLAWRRQGARLGWSLAPFLRRVDYLDAGAVGESGSEGLRGTVAYRLSPRWTLHADAAVAEFRFVGLAREDRDRRLGLGAEHQLAPRWALRFGASRFLRRSSDPQAGYAETLYSLFLIYRSDR